MSAKKRNPERKVAQKAKKIKIKEEEIEEDVQLKVNISLDPCDYELSKPFQCNVCNKCFKKKADLRKHERIHTGEKPYECPVCFKAFAIAGNLSKHRAVHSTERPWKCKICEKTYKQQKHLKSHLNIHANIRNYHCDICGKDFVHSWSWHCHMSNHSGVFKYKCDVCDKGFNITTDYKRHMFVHGGERPLKCDFCDKGFAHSTLLKRHVAVHHTVRNLKCNRCDKVFGLLDEFKAHKLTHKGEKHLKCEWCGKSFSKQSHLTRHYKVHKNKPALCSVCKKSFRTKEELLSHTETHIDILDDREEVEISNETFEEHTGSPNEIINPNDLEGNPVSVDVSVDCEETSIVNEDSSDEDETANLSDVASDNEEAPSISDDNDGELDEYEVCTVCKKVITSEKEFLGHMQSHIDELNALDEDEENPNSSKHLSYSDENCTGIETRIEENPNGDDDDEDDDDDIVCTKITNEVTGTTVLFVKDNESCLIENTSEINGKDSGEYLEYINDNKGCNGMDKDTTLVPADGDAQCFDDDGTSIEGQEISSKGIYDLYIDEGFESIEGSTNKDNDDDMVQDGDADSLDDSSTNIYFKEEDDVAVYVDTESDLDGINDARQGKVDVYECDKDGFNNKAVSQVKVEELNTEEESQKEDSQDGDSQKEDSQDGDSQDEESQDGDSQDEESQDEDSQDEDSQDEDSQDEDSQDEDSQDEDSQDEYGLGIEGNNGLVSPLNQIRTNMNTLGEAKHLNNENDEPCEMVPLSNINDYQLRTSAEIINGNENVVNVLISIDPEENDEYSKDLGVSDSILFAEKVNDLDDENCLQDHFLHENIGDSPQGIILNEKVELDIGCVSSEYMGHCGQIINDSTRAHDDEIDMGIPWVEYAMKADDS